MDILEQLQNKITQTIQSLENLQLANMELQEELDQARSELATAQQQNEELQVQYDELRKDQTRLTHEKHENEARVQSLLQTLDGAVADLLATDSPSETSAAENNLTAQQPTTEQPAFDQVDDQDKGLIEPAPVQNWN